MYQKNNNRHICIFKLPRATELSVKEQAKFKTMNGNGEKICVIAAATNRNWNVT